MLGKSIKKALIIIYTIIAFMAAILPQKYYCDALVVMIAVFLTAVIVISKGNGIQHNLRNVNILAVSFLSALFFLMTSYTQICRQLYLPLIHVLGGNTGLSLFAEIVLGAIFFSAVFVIIKAVFPHFKDNPAFVPDETFDGSARSMISVTCKSMLPAAVMALIFVIGGYDGFSFPDTLTVHNQVVLKLYSDWHTISYLLFVKLCRSLFPFLNVNSDFSVVVIQSLIYLAICGYAAASIYKYSGSRRAVRYYTIVLCMVFVPFLYLCHIVKDVPFSMLLFAFSIATFNFVNEKRHNIRSYCIVGILGLSAALFRHFAVVVVIVTGVILIICELVKYIKSKKVNGTKFPIWAGLIVVIPAIGYFFIVQVIGFGVFKAEKNPAYVTYTMPIYMTAAMYSNLGPNNFSSDDLQLMEELGPLDKWQSGYKSNIYWADTVTRNWGVFGNNINKVDNGYGMKIVKLNLKLFKSHPVQYIKCITDMSSIVWQIARPSDGYEWCPVKEATVGYEQGYANVKENTMSSITETMATASCKVPLVRTILWRGGIWLFLLVLVSVGFVAGKRGKNVLALLPLFLFLASLFISIPSQDPRYILATIEAGPFFAIQALSKPLQKG